jgi:glycosyltransferase involved in cell wall biosynthesis
VIHNGFDPARLDAQLPEQNRQQVRLRLGLAADELMLLAVGTVCERKNQKELLDALNRLSPAILQRVQVYIIGDRESAYSRELHQLVAELPATLAARIHLVPETGEVAPYYRAADVFVLTSRLESFPVVIQEAMHFSLPIVAHPSFGIREQVVHGKSALFYSSADTAELAERLHQVLDSEELRRELGHNARVSLGRLPTVPAMLADYAGVIQEAALSAASR